MRSGAKPKVYGSGMKLISQKTGLESLARRKEAYKKRIASFEARAKDCITCETPGACCLDAHFVNVRISRLEAANINEALKRHTLEKRSEIYQRIAQTVETYACPLFEKGTGCLVHHDGKPVPCITHACYENKSDLPPDELQMIEDAAIDSLNNRVYGRGCTWLPLPLAVLKYR
jgi:hypothetical protein